MVIRPEESAALVTALIAALFCAPAVATMSKFDSTFVP